MEPLSITASLIAVLQISKKVVWYLTDIKDASKDYARCAVEVTNLHSLLFQLRFRLEEEGTVETPWCTALRSLAVANGPIDQYEEALEILQKKMIDGDSTKKTGQALMWKFKKREISSILDRMERLKALIEIALQMDNL